MNVSLYQAAAAMNANQNWQDVISENLAANSVPGFKKQDVLFSTLVGAQGQSGLMPTSQAVTNFQQGPIQPTNVPTDIAIEGDGFFEVQLANGQTAYTRDGEFQFNAQGQLVTKQGYLVQTDSGPIQIDLKQPMPVSIAADGTISQGGNLLGKLKITTFNNPQLLSQIGKSYFIANNPALVPSAATPNTTQVRQGYLESGNVSPVSEMANMITAMRQFEANQRVLQIHDDRMGRAISDLGNPNAA
ncbi:MAG TPA: flagellar hook basal-body protein [Verrucomicrobiae bacterium]|nr:flagellar hook basal-body protein [Verrucomicrobiae bacterium]